jgi:hypothetical protein
MEEADAIQRLKRGDIGGLEILVKRYQVLASRRSSNTSRRRPREIRRVRGASNARAPRAR